MRRLAWMTAGPILLLGVWYWTSSRVSDRLVFPTVSFWRFGDGQAVRCLTAWYSPYSEFRLVANTLILVAGEDVELLLGAENLCGGGLRAGLEGGFHAMWKEFEEDLEVEAVFLMDAANAFNRLNREQALAEVRESWPRAARLTPTRGTR